MEAEGEGGTEGEGEEERREGSADWRERGEEGRSGSTPND